MCKKAPPRARASFLARRAQFRFRLPQPGGKFDLVAAIRMRFPENA